MSALSAFLDAHGPWAMAAAVAVLFAGGLAKGAVGFALPLVVVSGLATFLPPQLAVVIVVLPAFVSNIWQALFGGWRRALELLRRYWVLNAVLLPTLLLCAPLVTVLDEQTLVILLGAGISLFSAVQLLGWRPPDPTAHARPVEVATGLVAGFFGGIAAIWGPPIALYLLARRTPPPEQVQALGLSFFLGAVTLTGGYALSGALNAETGPLSAAAVIPVLLGMGVGLSIQKRLPPAQFRRVTLALMLLSGLNLLRKAWLG
jgi:uncharacterized membrane protein YfcA